MPKPHGGRLVRQILSGSKRAKILEQADEMASVEVSRDAAIDCENIARGVFSPLRGFLGSEDYADVLNHMRLSSDLPWTIPIILDVEKAVAESLSPGEEVILTLSGRPLALMELGEVFALNRELHSESVYGTEELDHPGVAKTYSRGDFLLGGDVWLLDSPGSPFPDYHLTPVETRVLFKEKGWRTVVGFQTRNIPHLGHEYLQKTALSFTDGLLINPVIGKKKTGDFKDEVIIKTYEALMEHYYLRQRAVLVTLQFEMRYAGPREAIFHAIVRKNYGCTHFIIGRDHAGVGSYYPPYAAQEIFEEFPDLGIAPLFFTSFFHCTRCGGVANDKTCPHSDGERLSFSGTRIREMLARGESPPSQIMRPEIAEIVLKWKDPLVA